ncbi:MAG: metal ABC transporter substrate-binding protein [Elusimicrobia bacterium]|nr:metal ABC transporter substrate-binding protein [Candidatus Obscuribacterium magneticum]MCB4755852.1 metal ABC transporter substrate-binding protein [Candidatus Obscuribacterium magneticum]
MISKIIVSALLMFSLSGLHAAVRVVTSSQDLESIAKMIGGDQVVVESLAAGDFDLHLIEPRPSMVFKVKQADMMVRVGMDLDMWMDSLIAASRNKNVVFGAPGYVDVSAGIPKLQVPEGKVDASMGDIHIFGNPHFWLDPVNGLNMAETILKGFIRVSPENEAVFRRNYAAFIKTLGEKIGEWDKKMEPFAGKTLVTYHNSWIYFSQRFRLDIVGNVEPKPGLPPTPSHLAKLIETMKAEEAAVILVDTFFPLQGPRKVAEKTGASILIVPSSVGGKPNVKNYFDLFDAIINDLVSAFNK